MLIGAYPHTKDALDIFMCYGAFGLYQLTDTGCWFPRDKAAGAWRWTHSSSAEVKNAWRYTYSTPFVFMV